MTRRQIVARACHHRIDIVRTAASEHARAIEARTRFRGKELPIAAHLGDAREIRERSMTRYNNLWI